MRTDVRRGVAAMAGAALAGLLGCVDRSPVSPTANVLVVQSVLDAGAHDQYVIVQQTDGRPARQVAVDGASVTLTAPDGSVLAAVEQHDSTRVLRGSGEPPVGTVYHVTLGTELLAPGATYRLRVVTPDGRVVTGATTIPSAAPASEVALDTLPFLPRDTLALAWPRVRGASRYEVHVVATLEELPREFSLFTDTSVALTLDQLTVGSGVDQAPIGGTNEIVVSAVDANYYDYYRHRPDDFTGTGVITHLDGAIGVFGSIVEIERRALKLSGGGAGAAIPAAAPADARPASSRRESPTHHGGAARSQGGRR